MRINFPSWLMLVFTSITLLIGPSLSAASHETLVWNQKENKVDADITSWDLSQLLQNVANATGWKVYLEPDVTRTVSAKFEKLPAGEALRAMLGNLNFVVMPASNGVSRLYVFRTSQQSATRLIRAVAKKAPAKPIPNEFVVMLKPGSKTKIEDLAKALGAKIVGRMDGQNAYRLQFDSAASADAARLQLADNQDVEGIDSNFYVQRPPDVNMSVSTLANDPDLQLQPRTNSPGDCQLMIAAIDTPNQSLGKNLDQFINPTIHVAGDVSVDPNTVTHSTAMISTMLGNLSKIDKGGTSVRIQPVDVYGNSEQATTYDVAKGIVSAANSGANLINLSLGSSGDSILLHKVITQVSNQGIPIFAAAGNEPVTTPTYPAAYPEVVAVTASDSSGKLADYANRGSFVDMIAPGDSVVRYNGQSYMVEGTSSATAYATSMAAALADRSHACADQALSLLKSSASGTASISTSK
ncbi:S8 family serine peptidase [Pedosphaera parvula]|nr:S8 family serine peptidase [Pedosphaera parvula]